MCSTDTKQVSPFPDHEAALLQVHQLQLDIEASQSQAVEKEETARKEIDELKLQVQECLVAKEHEKNVSAVANPFCQTSQEKRELGRSPHFCPAWTTKEKSGFLPGECSWAANAMISLLFTVYFYRFWSWRSRWGPWAMSISLLQKTLWWNRTERWQLQMSFNFRKITESWNSKLLRRTRWTETAASLSPFS